MAHMTRCDARRDAECEAQCMCDCHVAEVRKVGGRTYVVREVPMAPHGRLVAAPEGVTHPSRFYLSGRPRDLAGYRLA